jgi:hypothetical protein
MFFLLFIRLIKLRSGVDCKMLSITKDVFDYGQKGGKIMGKNGWLEERQIEERKDLIK